LMDAEGGDPVEISADPQMMRRYDENLKSWQAEIERYCQGRSRTILRLIQAFQLKIWYSRQCASMGCCANSSLTHYKYSLFAW
jgi:hypothetical protein